AERRGAWLGDDLAAIALLASLIEQAERCLPELVTSARLNGHSWDQIARALATRPQLDPAAIRPPIPDRGLEMGLPPLADPASIRGRKEENAHETRNPGHFKTELANIGVVPRGHQPTAP